MKINENSNICKAYREGDDWAKQIICEEIENRNREYFE